MLTVAAVELVQLRKGCKKVWLTDGRSPAWRVGGVGRRLVTARAAGAHALQQWVDERRVL